MMSASRAAGASTSLVGLDLHQLSALEGERSEGGELSAVDPRLAAATAVREATLAYAGSARGVEHRLIRHAEPQGVQSLRLALILSDEIEDGRAKRFGCLNPRIGARTARGQRCGDRTGHHYKRNQPGRACGPCASEAFAGLRQLAGRYLRPTFGASCCSTGSYEP